MDAWCDPMAPLQKDSTKSEASLAPPKEDWRTILRAKWVAQQSEIKKQIVNFLGVSPEFSVKYDDANREPYYPKSISILICGSDFNLYLAVKPKDPTDLVLSTSTPRLGEQVLTFKWKDGSVESITKKADGTFEYNTSDGQGRFGIQKGKLKRL